MITTTEFEIIETSKLIPYQNNARTHSQEQILKLRSSMREFGVINHILADNRMAMDAGWDDALLKVELEALQGYDFDVSLTGFEEQEIADLFAPDATDAKEDEFDVDEELAKPCFSKAGDI